MKMYHSSRIFSGEWLLSGNNIKYWRRVDYDAPYDRILNRPFDIEGILFNCTWVWERINRNANLQLRDNETMPNHWDRDSCRASLKSTNVNIQFQKVYMNCFLYNSSWSHSMNTNVMMGPKPNKMSILFKAMNT